LQIGRFTLFERKVIGVGDPPLMVRYILFRVPGGDASASCSLTALLRERASTWERALAIFSE
jgi:hypothetical protein